MDRSALREATLAGVRWVTVARIAGEVVAFASVVVLARLVPPAEFGRAAVALIPTALAVILTTDSFGAVLVQRKTVRREHLETAYLLSIATGATLTLATLALAPVAIEPLFGQRIAALIQVVSPVFILGGLGVVPHALLQRGLDFRRISAFEIAGRVLGAAASVALALAGLDGEAVVLGAVITSAISTLLLLTLAKVRVPVPRWDRAAAGEITAFGLPAALSSLGFSGVRNVDYAILAAKLSPAQVGFYYRAFQLGVDYQSKITGIMRRVAFPVYSRAVDSADMARLRARITTVQATVLFPLLAMLIATAPELIPFAFGDRWEPSVLPAQILAVAGMAMAMNTGTGVVMLAAGRTRALLVYNLVFLAVYSSVVLFAASYGLTVVCLGVAGVYIGMLLVAQRFLLERMIGISMRRLWVDVLPAGASSAALLIVTWPATRLLSSIGVSPFVTLPVAGCLGSVAYLLTLRSAFPAAWADVALLVRRVLIPKPHPEDTPGDAARERGDPALSATGSALSRR